MEISVTGNAALLNRGPSEPASGDVENKTGSAEASSVSQQASVDETNGVALPPPAPTTEVAPEDNTVQSNEMSSWSQVNLTV